MNENDAFEKEIFDLISLKCEGTYWDFKEKWNLDKNSLLHDIISMANNLENRDAYIIYGISDSNSKKGFDIVGVQNDENRKDQEKLITFLRDKKFVSGVRPVVYLKTMILDSNMELDVIIIKNTNQTPYFLIENFDRVQKFSIYTRIGDTNTPIDKTADINNIEYLWRKRFGIDRTPLEKVKILLEDPLQWHPIGTDGVHSNQKYSGQWHHIMHPEFTISIVDGLDNGAPYIGTGIDSRIFWLEWIKEKHHDFYYQTIEIRYFTTILYTGEMVGTVRPDFKRMLWKQRFIGELKGCNYIYTEKDSIEYKLDVFLCNSYETVEQTLRSRLIQPREYAKSQLLAYGNDNPYHMIIEFVDNNDHNIFLKYIENENILSEFAVFEGERNTIEHKDYLRRVGMFLKDIYEKKEYLKIL